MIRAPRFHSAVVAGCAALALVLTACAEGGEAAKASDGPPPTAGDETSTTAEPPPPGAEPPTAADLNQSIAQAFAGSMTIEQKAAVFEYGAQDPLLVDRFTEAAETNHLTLTVTEVRRTPAGAVAVAQVTSPTGVQDRDVPMIYEDGHWLITSEFTCSVVAAANLRSPVCPVPSPPAGN